MCPLTVQDETLRTSFAAAAPDAALSFNVSGWSWREDRQFPSWTTVLTAKLYTSPDYEELRKTLLARRFRATTVPGGSADVLSVRVEGRADVNVNNLIRVYAPSSCPSVPGSVAGLVVKLAVHNAKALQAAPEHVVAALAAGALTVVWGYSNDVAYVTSRIPNLGAPLKTTDILYFVKGRTGPTADYTAVPMLIRVLGNPGYMKSAVCAHVCAFLFSRGR